MKYFKTVKVDKILSILKDLFKDIIWSLQLVDVHS